MIDSFKNQLADAIISSPIVYIQHYHFSFFDELLSDVLSSGMIEGLDTSNIFEYDTANQFIVDFKTKSILNRSCFHNTLLEKIVFPSNDQSDEQSKSNGLKKEHRIYLFKNSHRKLSDPIVHYYYQTFTEKYERGDYDYKTTIIIVSPTPISEINAEISKYFSVINIPLPDKNDIEHELGLSEDQIDYSICSKREPYESENRYRYSISFMHGLNNFESNKRDLISALSGMEIFDIRNILRTIQLSDGYINPWYESQNCKLSDRIFSEKRKILNNTGLLELIDLAPDQKERVGNINTLLEFIESQKKIIDNISNYPSSMPKPKGILLVGPPGCGKSETVKTIAAIYDKPLVRLDVGRLMGKYVGQSENNLIYAIHIAEAAQPCVLWIDEIEKAFAGSESGENGNDAMVHMLGYLLTWMQERKSLVYLVATANDLSSLRPEFLRKGRWDEIFYLSYPDSKGAMDILLKCLKKYGLCLKDKNDVIVVDTDGIVVDKGVFESMCDSFEGSFSGAEIDSLVVRLFSQNWNRSYYSRYIIYEDMKKEIDSIKKTKARAERRELNEIIRSILLDFKLQRLESGMSLVTEQNNEEKADNNNNIGKLPNQDTIVALLEKKYTKPGPNDITSEYESNGYVSAS